MSEIQIAYVCGGMLGAVIMAGIVGIASLLVSWAIPSPPPPAPWQPLSPFAEWNNLPDHKGRTRLHCEDGA